MAEALPAISIVGALISDDQGRYLMQLRDDAAHIRFHWHWCLFGGGVEPGEDPRAAMYRELDEELGFHPKTLTWFTELTFEAGEIGVKPRRKSFFSAPISAEEFARTSLHEGAGMRLMSLDDILAEDKVVPWDLYALVLHGRIMKEPSAVIPARSGP